MHARAALIVGRNGDKVVGPRFIRLLEEIATRGSVRRATDVTGLGYRHAIAWIRRAEAVLGRSLVVRQAGGTSGGGSDLSDDGAALVRAYRGVSRSIDRIVRQAESQLLGPPNRDHETARRRGAYAGDRRGDRVRRRSAVSSNRPTGA